MKVPGGHERGRRRVGGDAAAAARPVQSGVVAGRADSAGAGAVQASLRKGLIDVPPSPPKKPATAVAARLVAAPFDSFMKLRRFEVDVARPGVAKVETVTLDVLSGPGHNCSMAAALVLDGKGRPSVVLKAGDTRAARTLRGEPYVKIGMIGGRWDKVGADAKKIGLDEIAEEIGAELIQGGYLPLGDKLVPTMPGESTEADRYFAALVRIPENGGAVDGDGGGMEVPGLMKPVTMPVAEALAAMDDGRVGEGARARVAYARAFDAIGWIPQLASYVHDLPGSLKKRFDTLGLAPAIDPRHLPTEIQAADPAAQAQGHGGAPGQGIDPHAGQIDAVAFTAEQRLELPGGAAMIDAKTVHVAHDGGVVHQVGKPFQNQILHLPYDRAKLAVYYLDPVQGPMVRMDQVERPVLAVKGLALDGERSYKLENTELVRRDVPELQIQLEGAQAGAALAAVLTGVKAGLTAAGITGAPVPLGAPVDASPGQTDLRYHFYGVTVAVPAEAAERARFVPLSDAIALCRQGEGDAATEALLLRLADAAGWVPSLRMSLATAEKLLKHPF